MGWILTEAGRIRLGLRILLFLLLTVAFTVAASGVIPGGMPYGAIPVLLGSLVGGGVLLHLDGRRLGALGFYISREAGREVLHGLALGLTAAGGVVGGLVAIGALRWELEPSGALHYLAEGGRAAWLFGLPAAAEEALMRGYLLQALAEAWGGLWALGATSVLFGALHLGNPHVSWVGLANIVVAGLFLGAVYLKTASLWWATGAHMAWNWGLGFLADLPVSGLELLDAPLVEARTRGPDWVSGGSFGPEGSVVSTLILLGMTLVLWKASWLRPGARAKELRPLHLGTEA